MAEEKDIRGQVNTRKYAVVEQSKIPALQAGLSEYDPDDPGHELRFAQLVQIVGGLTMDVGDVSIGAVELKDATTDTRQNIVPLAGYNAAAMMLVDSNGTQIEAFGGSAEQISGAVAAAKVLQMGGIAESNVPISVADGETVQLWVNEYGQLVLAGYNPSSNSMNVEVVNQGLLNVLGPIDNIAATGVPAIGPWANVSKYHNHTIHIYATLPVGVTVIIESSTDGVEFVELDSITVTKNEERTFDNVQYEYLRTVVTGITSGTVRTVMSSGN